jgi:uncharacterized protein (DUF58 family)
MLTAEELQQIRRLQLQLERRVDSPFAGEYRSAFRGRGMAFEEVRPYLPGDDVRHIDWNVLARTGQAHIKEFAEERELTLMLVMDVSGSMLGGWGGRDGRTDKRTQVARLAGALAHAAIRNQDRVGLLAFSDGTQELLPPRKSRGHAWAVIRAAFAQPEAMGGTSLSASLAQVHRLLRRRSVVCVFSDFLAPAPFDTELRILARRHQVHAFCVHDPLDQGMPDVGLVEIEDAESGRVRTVDSGSFGATAGLEERLRALRATGARVQSVGTGEDPFTALHHHFRGRRA